MYVRNYESETKTLASTALQKLITCASETKNQRVRNKNKPKPSASEIKFCSSEAKMFSAETKSHPL